MSSTHQWGGRLVPSMMLIVTAGVAALALLPTASLAHPGHDHGLASATGRMPGVPDYQKIDGVVSRFDTQSREYILRKPGKPAVSAHVESDARPTPEGLAANGGRSSLPPGEIQPACATSGHRIVVVNAYDAGTKTADAEDAHVRSLVKRMNWKFVQQSQLSSNPDRTLQMKVDCDGSGATTITDIAVPFGYKSEGIDTTDGDIGVLDTMLYVEQKLGEPEGANSVKYLIFNDKSRSGFVGVGYKYSDATKSSSNINLKYTSSAFISRNPKHTTDGKDSWESTIPIHELLHVMGAALNYESEPGKWIAAPYATTGSHCIDGIDILCYADLTSAPEGSYSEGRCPADAGHESAERVTLDCGFDTYFDAETEPGEWLSQWWNVGGEENPFLVYTPGAPPVATAPAAFTKPADFETYNATLKGIVNPGGVSTTYKFEYGTTTSYGSSVPTPPKSIGSGIEDVQVSETIKTEPGVTYHYRVVATNSKGTFYGEDMTVKTSFWMVQPIQGPASSKGRGELRDVSCPSSIYCVAVGTDTKGATLGERWSGGTWSVMTTANPAGEGSLEKVSCSSASFCIATGKVGSTLFSEYWNGSSWSLVGFPLPVGSKGSAIEAISCTSSTACVAVGRYTGSKGEFSEWNTLIEHWDGSKWSIVPSPNAEGKAFSRLFGVSCVSATSCLAVGFANEKLGSAPAPLVQKWDGSKWSIISAPTPPGGSGTLLSVSCPVASFCMASGAGAENLAFAASWDGASWKAQGSGLPNALRSISCATQNSCELVGSLTKGQHWNGSGWSALDLATPPETTDAQAFRVSCPAASLCTAVGTYVGVPFFSPGERPLAERLTPAPHVEFRAEKYSTEAFSTTATAEQSGSHKFTNVKAQNLTCGKATATGSMPAPSSVMTLVPAYKECSFLGTGATPNPNSCQYVINSTNDKEPFTGSVEIACNKENDGIEFTTSICTLKLPAQKAIGTATFTNTGKKSRGRTITATFSLSGVEYTETSKFGACGATSKAGTYAGTYVISGSEIPVGYPEEKEPVGLYMAKEQVMVPPLIEAQKYSAVIKAEGNTSISMPGKGGGFSFSCSATGKGQGLLKGASKELGLTFKKWTGCYYGGSFSISMNGCSFVLRPLVGQLPYTTGSTDIVCPVGKEITFSLPLGGCDVKIPTQSGLNMVKTENLGSGSTATVSASLTLSGLTYTQDSKFLCGSPGTHSDGTLGGSWTLKGHEYLGTQEVEGGLEYKEGAQLGAWIE